MGAWESANEAALLAAGNRPEWVEQTSYTGPPTSAGDGVYLSGALRTLVAVDMRESVARRTARITVSGTAASGFARVLINGITTSTSENQTAAEIAAGLIASINVHASLTDVTATEGDTPEEIVVTGDTDTEWSIETEVTVAGVTLECVADPVAANVILWGRMTGIGSVPGGWRTLRGWEALGIHGRGFVERFDTAGIDRLYVELRHVSGHPDDGEGVTYVPAVHVGPSVLP